MFLTDVTGTLIFKCCLLTLHLTLFNGACYIPVHNLRVMILDVQKQQDTDELVKRRGVVLSNQLLQLRVMTFAYKDVILIWALSIICISMEDTVMLRFGIEWGWEVCSPLHTSGNYNLYPCKEPNKKACIHNSYLLVHTCNQTQSLCIQAESEQQTKHGGVACVEPVQVGPGSRMRARLTWEMNQSRP
jgi:hypothetical protein